MTSRRAEVDDPLGLEHAREPRFGSPDEVGAALAANRYLADPQTASVVFLADRLVKPVLVEGPAGTGKTQLGKTVADALGARLIRLQWSSTHRLASPMARSLVSAPRSG